MSKVSIVVPVYNAGRFLEETLDSIVSQTETDWECILVNDGSTDDSVRICEEYVNADRRFALIHKQNDGSADLTRAFAYLLCHSPFTCMIDADDVIENVFLEKLLLRQKETNADIVGAVMYGCIHELEGELYRIPEKDFDLRPIMTGKEACALCIGGWGMTAIGMLYRISLNEGVLRGHYMNSDEFSSRQIIFKAKKVAFCDARYIYRNHNESVSRRVSHRLWERMFVDQQIEEFVLSNYEEDEAICCKAVHAHFFNMVHLAADAYLETRSLERKSRNRIRKGVRFAYGVMDKEKIGRYLPKHNKLFMHGSRWFVLISVMYQLIRIVRGKRFYDYK